MVEGDEEEEEQEQEEEKKEGYTVVNRQLLFLLPLVELIISGKC